MAASKNPSSKMEPASNDSIKIYFPESSSSKSKPSLPPAPVGQSAGRRGKGAAAQPPRCQVEGCGVDLTGLKTYYCRHKVCGPHSKAARVVVSGVTQRFCQQCSRFHELTEFDQRKRSCRRRLAGHNERRRKQVPSLCTRFGHLAGYPDFTYTRPPSSTNNRDHWSTFIRPVNPFQTPFVGPNPYLSGPNPLCLPTQGVCLDSSSALSLLSNGSRSTIPLYDSNEPLGFRDDDSNCALCLLSNGSVIQAYNSNESLRFRTSNGPLGFRASNGPGNSSDCLAGVGLTADSSCALSLLSNGSVIQSYNSNESFRFRADGPSLDQAELEYSGNELELVMDGNNGPYLGGGPEFAPGFI